MKKQVLAGVIALVLSGCASISVKPPAPRDFEGSRTYNMSFEKTWTRAVDWYADHNVKIEKIQKESGLLTAKYMLEANDQYVDCGNIDVQGVLGDPDITRAGSLNVTVRRAGDRTTRVNVNFFGAFELRARDAWDGREVYREGRCISTGHLEQEILDYIESP